MSKIATRVQTLATEPVAANIAKGAALTHEELDNNFYYLNVTTNGTVEANKAIIAGTGGNITSVGTIGCGAITSTGASTFGSISDSVATLDGAGALTGLTNLVVDSLTLNGDVISSSGAITLTPTAGSAVVIDGLSIDDGVITSASNISITSTGGTVQIEGGTTFTGANVTGMGTLGCGAITSTGAVQGTSVTDGTASFGGAGALNGVASIDATTETTLEAALELDSLQGNLSVSHLNSGTSASASTYWRGDGTWGTPPGAGDVSGPVTSTDHAIARWDLTGGDTLLNSSATISDGGTLTTVDLVINETATFDAEGAASHSGATLTIDWLTGNKQEETLSTTNITTVTFTNPPAGPCSLTLKLTQDSVTPVTCTGWPAAVKWPNNGTEPILSTGVNDVDIISFYFDGTNYYGVATLDFA